MIHCPECGKLLTKYTQKVENGKVQIVILKCSCGADWGYSYKIKGNLIEFIDTLTRIK